MLLMSFEPIIHDFDKTLFFDQFRVEILDKLYPFNLTSFVYLFHQWLQGLNAC